MKQDKKPLLIVLIFVLMLFTWREAAAECNIKDSIDLDLLKSFRLDEVEAHSPVALEELGKALFFDRRLSGSNSVACADCHRPEEAFSARSPVLRTASSVISLLDVRYSTWFFWDGRADSLWSASRFPILSKDEMNGDPSAVAALMAADAKYRDLYLVDRL